MDPLVEALLVGLVKAAPQVFTAIADAIRGGDTPEQAVAKARRVAPLRLDTTEEDAARRERILGKTEG